MHGRVAAPDLEHYDEFEGIHVAQMRLAEIGNDDVRAIVGQVHAHGPEKALEWLDSHRNGFDPSTVVTTATDPERIAAFRRYHPKAFVILTPLNRIRGVNKLMEQCSDELPEGGWLAVHARTANLKKQLILSKYIWPLNRIVYAFHYIWHRMFPKMDGLTHKIYFGITGGGNRTYSRVEILGRIVRAGFTIRHEEFRHGQFLVLATKERAPLRDREPSCGPVIRLRRHGKGGEMITVHKFRTMFSYSEYLQDYVYRNEGLREGGKFASDYRINFWGKLMRGRWLDELPMVFDVLRGRMKWVGVRPLSDQYYKLYSPEARALRDKVKPGLLPPYYYDRVTPTDLAEIEASERRYIESYLRHPGRTDRRYFRGIMANIIFRRKHSR